jgi:glycosyltransferase involved in cell wall biosynthesis
LTVTKPFAEGFLKRWPQLPRSKFSVITNGYDEEDFINILTPKRPRSKKFTMVHIGSFLAIRTPKYFLEGLRLLLEEVPSLQKKIQVLFAGRWEARDERLINDMKLTDIIKLKDYISHQEAISQLYNSDVLLLILAGTETGVYPGKIFEYLAAAVPILALVPKDGIAAELIKTTRAGMVVNHNDIGNIKKAILTMYQQHTDGNLAINPDHSVINKFERKRLTKSLAATLDQVL